MDETSNNCSFDLYSDLIEDNFNQKEHSYNELEQKFSNIKEESQTLRQQLEEALTKVTIYQSENIILKKNISSLLKTAKTEIERKNQEIGRLRRCQESRWRRQQRVHFPRRSNHNLTNRGADDDSSQTGDTYDRVTDTRHSSANLGFSNYGLGKTQEGATCSDSAQCQTQKSSNDRLSPHQAGIETPGKDKKCDQQQKEKLSRSKSAPKSVEDFVADVRRKTEMKKERTGGKKTELPVTDKFTERKGLDLRQKLNNRSIDVSKGRLDGRQVKSSQRSSETLRYKDTSDKSRDSAKNRNQEKENVSTPQKLISRKRRHVSDSDNTLSSKRTKALKSPQEKSTDRKDSTLRKYLQVSPVSKTASKSVPSNYETKSIIGVKMNTESESKHVNAQTHSEKDEKFIKENCSELSDVKTLSVDKNSVTAVCKSETKTMTISNDSKITNCRIEDKLSSDEETKIVCCVEQVQKNDQKKNDKTDSRQLPESSREKTNKCSRETSSVPESSGSSPQTKSVLIDQGQVKISTIKVPDAEKNRISSIDICEESAPVTPVLKKADCPTDIVDSHDTPMASEPQAERKLEVPLSYSDSHLAASSNNCTFVLEHPIESDSKSSVLSTDVNDCSSSDISLDSCQRTAPRRNSACTVTSTTLWESHNGITTWIPDVETVNGVKKYRLRPLKPGDPLFSSSAESILPSESNSSVSLSASLCSNGDLKTVRPSEFTKMSPVQSPVKTNGCSVNDSDHSALSPFKTPASTPSLDKLPDPDPVQSPEISPCLSHASVNSSLPMHAVENQSLTVCGVKICPVEEPERAASFKLSFSKTSDFDNKDLVKTEIQEALKGKTHTATRYSNLSSKTEDDCRGNIQKKPSSNQGRSETITCKSSEGHLSPKEKPFKPFSRLHDDHKDVSCNISDRPYVRTKRSSVKSSNRYQASKSDRSAVRRDTKELNSPSRTLHSRTYRKRYSPINSRKRNESKNKETRSERSALPVSPSDSPELEISGGCLNETSESLLSIPDDVYVFIGEESLSESPLPKAVTDKPKLISTDRTSPSSKEIDCTNYKNQDSSLEEPLREISKVEDEEISLDYAETETCSPVSKEFLKISEETVSKNGTTLDKREGLKLEASDTIIDDEASKEESTTEHEEGEITSDSDEDNIPSPKRKSSVTTIIFPKTETAITDLRQKLLEKASKTKVSDGSKSPDRHKYSQHRPVSERRRSSACSREHSRSPPSRRNGYRSSKLDPCSPSSRRKCKNDERRSSPEGSLHRGRSRKNSSQSATPPRRNARSSPTFACKDCRASECRSSCSSSKFSIRNDSHNKHNRNRSRSTSSTRSTHSHHSGSSSKASCRDRCHSYSKREDRSRSPQCCDRKDSRNHSRDKVVNRERSPRRHSHKDDPNQCVSLRKEKQACKHPPHPSKTQNHNNRSPCRHSVHSSKDTQKCSRGRESIRDKHSQERLSRNR